MIYLGTSGWSYKDWIGPFYPENLKQNKWLEFYSKKFDTVEVNASFYRLPFKNMVKGWKNKTPDDFLLTFKGSKLITHNKKLKEVDKYLEKFYNRIKLAEEKVGVILWQLHPKIKKDLDLLENFLNKLDKNIKQCVEFRDKSWFCSDVYSLLEKYNVAFCIISAPSLPTNIQITTNFAYIRWHGEGKDWYRYDYSDEQLNGWATQIKKLEVNDVFGYFNNDYDAFAPKNCLKLKKILEG
jgi:uncharacterized protein YecE (DUF72 family)